MAEPQLIVAPEIPPSLARVHPPTREPLRVGAVQEAWHPDPEEHADALGRRERQVESAHPDPAPTAPERRAVLRIAPSEHATQILSLHGPVEPEAGAERTEPVLYLSFGDDSIGSPDRRWRSMTTVLETTGRDMTRSEYLEFYAAAETGRIVSICFSERFVVPSAIVAGKLRALASQVAAVRLDFFQPPERRIEAIGPSAHAQGAPVGFQRDLGVVCIATAGCHLLVARDAVHRSRRWREAQVQVPLPGGELAQATDGDDVLHRATVQETSAQPPGSSGSGRNG